VLFASSPPTRFDGLVLTTSNSLSGTALVTPLAVVLVSPEFFQDAVDDMIRAALYEPGIVLNQLIDWLFEFYFASRKAWGFLND
jgi:hypothetical protein